MAYVTGFGRTLKASRSSVKQKLQLPIFDQAACRKKFLTKNVEIFDDQICAGGKFSEDACDGDSGKKDQEINVILIIKLQADH